MSIEKSAGAVIFRKEFSFASPSYEATEGKEGKIYYLLLNYSAIGKLSKTYWGFPKGHIENSEKEIDTIKREVEEEAGITDLKFAEGFKETEKYFFKHDEKTIFKTVYYLLAETSAKEIRLSHEHIGFVWLPYEEALKKLSFKNAKDILKKANEFLRTPGH